ncbi:transglycosylase SLT domain-containing protein [Streptomyces hyaluromycini]|uniref:transglycosylase SLT domain-containing protein n=1 Tax=Streptomyces hyaluromycini TaxID=1377993 RepID=UPI000B5C51E9|nr:transglycosylase SLT domain-containing protein [Streptomyces hyaluromycini]
MSLGAGQPPDEGGTSRTVRNTLAAGTGFGILLSPLALLSTTVIVIIFGGLGVILAPLIALILLFSGGGDSGGDPNAVMSSFQGDGKGELDSETVPSDLEDTINEAGGLCDPVGPVVIAAQIERESGWNASLTGLNGEQGLSQLPPDVFKQYGKDEDDNGSTSALDPKDSIMAQGRFMCDLADQAQKLIDSGAATGKVLDLALAGYDEGMDTVRAARGVPQTNEGQGYVLGVRALFAKYDGTAPIPFSSPPATPSPSASTPTPES